MSSINHRQLGQALGHAVGASLRPLVDRISVLEGKAPEADSGYVPVDARTARRFASHGNPQHAMRRSDYDALQAAEAATAGIADPRARTLAYIEHVFEQD